MTEEVRLTIVRPVSCCWNIASRLRAAGEADDARTRCRPGLVTSDHLRTSWIRDDGHAQWRVAHVVDACVLRQVLGLADPHRGHPVGGVVYTGGSAARRRASQECRER